VDRFDNMRVFAKVVERRQLHRRSGTARISASMVSQHVKELEERLGARLLNRTTRKVSLTDTGRAYYEALHPAAGRSRGNRASRKRHARDARAGSLRVNATPSFGILHLAPPLRFHHALSRNLRRTDAEQPYRRPDRGRF